MVKINVSEFHYVTFDGKHFFVLTDIDDLFIAKKMFENARFISDMTLFTPLPSK